MKVVCGLGNPGAGYDATRHNVGWWVVEAFVADTGLGPFRREGLARVAAGALQGTAVRVLEPVTYMNRSGAALAQFRAREPFDPETELLVVLDDAALEPGRVRIRARGSAGGHNGLKSVESVLGTRDYARLRIGVGSPPPGEELSDWVLSPFEEDDAARIRELIPELVEAVRVWVVEGVEAAARRFNR